MGASSRSRRADRVRARGARPTRLLVSGHLALRMCGVTVVACGTEPTGSGAVWGAPSVAHVVTPEVARSLDANGHFVFDHREALGPEAAFLEARAARIAQLVVASLSESLALSAPTAGIEDLRSVLERGHGAPIPWSSLKPVAGRLGYMRTVVDSSHPPLPAYAAAHLGSRFQVVFGGQGRPVILVTVAADSSHVRLSQDGRRVESMVGGAMLASAIPISLADSAVPVPEVATLMAATAFGRRAAAVPELVMPWPNLHPFFARWRIRFDDTVHVATSEGAVTTDEVYVGFGAPGLPMRPTFFVASGQQPAEDSIRILLDVGSVAMARLFLSRVRPTRLIPVQ